MTEPTTEARPPFMARHDLGCRCWPHVTEADAHEAILQAATKEYEQCQRDKQEAVRAALTALRERVEAIDDVTVLTRVNVLAAIDEAMP